jgi:NTE family protein
MEVDLVLSGSGTRFPVFIGALKALEEKNVDIVRVAGTSGGALIAACIACKIKADDLFQMVLKTDFKTFKDFSLISLVRNYGLYKGDVIEKLSNTVTGGITFRYLPIDCRIIACNPLHSQKMVFSKANTPDMKLSEAIRYSTSIPLIFGYKKYQDVPIVDGMLSSNYPIDTFDDNERKTLGLRITTSSRQKCCFNKLNIFEYIWFLVESLIISLENENIEDSKNADTINLDAKKFDPINFDLTETDKNEMFQLGYLTTLAYLEANK